LQYSRISVPFKESSYLCGQGARTYGLLLVRKDLVMDGVDVRSIEVFFNQFSNEELQEIIDTMQSMIAGRCEVLHEHEHEREEAEVS
jgi:hypothetical protein